MRFDGYDLHLRVFTVVYRNLGSAGLFKLFQVIGIKNWILRDRNVNPDKEAVSLKNKDMCKYL